ncbi:hypothetical protein DID88_008341 [Monilinia fructigena]|uniref:FAD-binding PCMH-type domain-containing protein n=1 Tax=Monilinia fructigena TaxID=38457 RepID=A0A395J625_9HELO|nr:hypothetical protein DID88_008341 [Monilinia fructigena]
MPFIHDLIKSLTAESAVISIGDKGYEESIKRWAVTAEKRAGLIVFPATASDVSKAILCATQLGVDLAVAGGFHSTSGSSSTDGGISINLSKMRGVTADPEAMKITVQGGALWEDVDNAAAKHGLATVGGTVNQTGVGGLTLGGGYGYLSGQYGLVIDNLLSVQMVLASGQVKTVSERESPELFWAVRGAGAAFGVATEFVLRAYKQENLDLAPLNQINNVYNGPEESARKLFEPILKLGSLLNTTAMIPYPAVNAFHNPFIPPGARRTMKGSTFTTPLDIPFVEGMFKDYVSFIQSTPDAEKTLVLWEFISPHKIMSMPQNATSFANRGPYGNVVFASAWTNVENDLVCRDWTRAMAKKARNQLLKTGTGAGKQGVGEYANYEGMNETPAKTLFGDNYERLVELKMVFDPRNIFGKCFNLMPGHGGDVPRS